MVEGVGKMTPQDLFYKLGGTFCRHATGITKWPIINCHECGVKAIEEFMQAKTEKLKVALDIVGQDHADSHGGTDFRCTICGTVREAMVK